MVLEVGERLLRRVAFRGLFVDILRERDATMICMERVGTEYGLETADIRFGTGRCDAVCRERQVFGEGADVATLFHVGTVIIENITDRIPYHYHMDNSASDFAYECGCTPEKCQK